MATYTPKQRAEALDTVATQGIEAAHKQHGVSRETLRAWAKKAQVVPFDGRRSTRANAEQAAIEQRAVADAERSTRQAQAQTALSAVAGQQATLVSAHQQVAAKIARRIMLALNALDAAEARAGGDVTAKPVRDAEAKLDRELARARSASISYGVHVDKLLQMAGEDMRSATANGNQAGTSSAVTILLTQDPEFRREVSSSVAARYKQLTGQDVVEVHSK